MDIRFAALDPEVADGAGEGLAQIPWNRSGRERHLPEFLIETHAWMRADRFLTRIEASTGSTSHA
jgi:hypothetical protein